jgi:hypothetical protein
VLYVQCDLYTCHVSLCVQACDCWSAEHRTPTVLLSAELKAVICVFSAFQCFSRQNLQDKRSKRTASFRTTPYGQGAVIDTEGYAASMGRQVRSTVTLSKTQQPLCSYVTDRLQGALNRCVILNV